MAYSLYNYGVGNIRLPESDVYMNARDRRGKSISFPIGDNIQNGNTLVVGTTRTGKTLFIKNMVAKLRASYPDELFIFMDVKQDYISDLRLYKDGDYIVSYAEIAGTSSLFQWSIIYEAFQNSNSNTEIKEIVETLFESLPDQGSNQMFVESAKLAFGAYLLTYIEKLKEMEKIGIKITKNDIPSNAEIIERYNKMTFQNLRKWIGSVIGQRRLCDEILPAQPNGMPTKYAQSVLNIIRIFVEIFDGNFCGKKKDSIYDFIASNGKAMFLEFDYSKQRSSAAFFRLFLKKIIQEKMALNSLYRSKKIYLILDESAVLRGDFDLINALNIGAGDGLRIIVACQSIDHLYMQAPKELNDKYGSAMLAGFSNVICFRPADGNTVNAIQEKYGKADIERIVMPVDRYQSAQVSIINDYIVNAEQLTTLGLGESYVKLKADRPIKIYFEEE